MKIFVKTIASFFGLGYSPFASGTVGSLAGLAIAWFFPNQLIVIAVVLSAAGFIIAAPSVQAFGEADPKKFVLDEVCGMLLGVLWLPRNAAVFLGAFILFRLLDIWKPWPLILIQKNENPACIVWDDLAAGAAANGIIRLLLVYKSSGLGLIS